MRFAESPTRGSTVQSESTATPTRRKRWTGLWACSIVLACSIPGQELPEVDLLRLDKAVHYSLFFVLAVLAAWPPAVYRPAAVWIGGTAFAVLTECYQWLMPIGRSFDMWDVAANAAGLFSGIALCALRQRRIRTGRRHPL